MIGTESRWATYCIDIHSRLRSSGRFGLGCSCWTSLFVEFSHRHLNCSSHHLLFIINVHTTKSIWLSSWGWYGASRVALEGDESVVLTSTPYIQTSASQVPLGMNEVSLPPQVSLPLQTFAIPWPFQDLRWGRSRNHPRHQEFHPSSHWKT